MVATVAIRRGRAVGARLGRPPGPPAERILQLGWEDLLLQKTWAGFARAGPATALAPPRRRHCPRDAVAGRHRRWSAPRNRAPGACGFRHPAVRGPDRTCGSRTGAGGPVPARDGARREDRDPDQQGTILRCSVHRRSRPLPPVTRSAYEGNCYQPGEYCRDSYHGVSGTDANGDQSSAKTTTAGGGSPRDAPKWHRVGRPGRLREISTADTGQLSWSGRYPRPRWFSGWVSRLLCAASGRPLRTGRTGRRW